MATVSEVAVQYRAKGAKAAQRADEQVRSSVQETAKTARSERGEISRWMERHQSAIKSIGVATGAVLGALLSASPTMRAELAGVRMAFSLFADTVVNDVLPSGGGLIDMAFDLQERYAALPDPIRETISSITAFGAVAGVAVAIVGGLVAIVGATTLAIVGLAAVVSGVLLTAWQRDWPVIGTLVQGVVDSVLLALRTLQNFISADSWSERFNILLGFVKDFATIWIRTWAQSFREVVAGALAFVTELLGLFAQLGSDLYEWAAGLASDAYTWGRDLIAEFISGIRSKIGGVTDAAGGVRDAIEDKLSFDIEANDRAARRWGSDLMEEMAAGIEMGAPALEGQLETPQPSPATPEPAVSGGGGTTVIVEQYIDSGGSPQRTADKSADAVSEVIQDEFASRR